MAIKNTFLAINSLLIVTEAWSMAQFVNLVYTGKDMESPVG